MTERERRYTDRELGLILKRATQLQEGSSISDVQGDFSLAEIQSVAEAAGIDPRFIVEAARDVADQEEPRRSWLHGAASRYEFSETLPGELEPAGIGDVIEAARRETESQGEVSEVLDSVEWRAQDLFRTRVTITRRSGRTRIRVFLDGDRAEAMIFTLGGAAGALGTIAAGALLSVDSLPGVLAVAAAGTAATYCALSAVWWRVANGVERRGRELFHSIARAATEDIGQESTRT